MRQAWKGRLSFEIGWVCLLAEKLIRFALLLPLTGVWDIGLRVAGAATLAVSRVNADKALLPGYRLGYGWANSGCSAQQGLTAMGVLLAGESRINAVIGPGCSSACLVTSPLSGGQDFPQISWGCTSPLLSKKEDHRLVKPCDLACHAWFDCPPLVLILNAW